jgi:hypothetical protein
MLRSLPLLAALLLSPLVSPTARAAVWPTVNTWNQAWELKYERWVRTNWKVDIFTNRESPYFGVMPDCADTVYSMRAIFAFENNLPFAVVDPSTMRSVITNEMKRFDKLPAGPRRLVAYLNWLRDVVSTASLQNDTYPTAISRATVRSGGLMLAKESKHSYTIKQVRDTGVPVLYYSTQANTGNLMVRSWPSVSYLFSQGIKEPSGIRDFRLPEDLLKPVWMVPGYSTEQYEVSANKWTPTMQSRLALRNESTVEALERVMDDLCQLSTFRVQVVNEAMKKLDQIGDRCLTATEFDDLSTPSRDSQNRQAFQELAILYNRAIKKGEKLPPLLAEQLANIHAPRTSQERGAQFCALNYGRRISLGEVRGPSDRAARCPVY